MSSPGAPGIALNCLLHCLSVEGDSEASGGTLNNIHTQLNNAVGGFETFLGDWDSLGRSR